ncbi:hypothetical protein COP1_031048 [Malus domestica]
MPTPVLRMKSPFEVLFHSPRRLDHLKVFGCACYPSLKPYRTNKLDPKTTPCIFVGYAAQYKGYICFDVSKNELIVSRHVLFNETHYPTLSQPFDKQYSSLQTSTSPPHIVHSNTFHQSPIIAIPLPYVFQPTVASPQVTQSSSLSHGDIVSSPITSVVHGTSESSPISELHPDITTSQVSNLQLVNINSQNCHPMQTNFKSSISKKKKVFNAIVQSSIGTKPTSFTTAY